MRIDLVALPSGLRHHHLHDRVVVVFDVLRATTTIVTALASGAAELRVFDSLDGASRAASQHHQARLLCGEQKCLPPPGFDLGNSPGDFTAERVAGKTIFMSTTNGTRAIVPARDARHLLAAALVNASATARHLALLQIDVTLLCAGTNGEVAPEDMLGAGAVADRLRQIVGPIEFGVETVEAERLFQDSRRDLVSTLRSTQGGRNVVNAGLEPDIDFAARLDAFGIAVNVRGDPPVARRIME
jgi:2-phosphosulfolactate phosphatase